MRVLPEKFAAEWATSANYPEVEFLVQPVSGREREWAQARNSRTEDAGYEPQAYEIIQALPDGPNKGKLAVLDTYGVAYDQARVALLGLRGAEIDEGVPFELEREKLRFYGGVLKPVTPECFERLPFDLQAEIVKAAASGAELSAPEAEGVGFTSGSDSSA